MAAAPPRPGAVIFLDLAIVQAAVYDAVQALDYGEAARTSAALLVLSFVLLALVYGLLRPKGRSPWPAS